MGDQDQPNGQASGQSQTGAAEPPPPATSDITVTGAPRRGPSAGDVVRVGGAVLTNPTGVGGKLIRNERLIEAGDDLAGQRPTIGTAVRLAEAIGDGANDRKAGNGALTNRFNQITGFSVTGVPVTRILPGGGVVDTASDFLNSRERTGNRIGELGTNLLGQVPGVGVLAGVFRGNQDVSEVRRGIRLLSDNSVPGFRYDETMIDGHRVRIYVSAADTITNNDAHPWVNIDTDGINKRDPRVQARAQAVLGTAMDDLYNFTTTLNDQDVANGGDGISPQETQTALFGRMREVITNMGATAAPIETARISSSNALVNGASAAADLVAP